MAPRLRIVHGGVTSQSTGTGDAGNIVIVATDRLELDDGTITTEAAAGGGGRIAIEVGLLIDLLGSEITTSVAGDATTTAGDLTLDPRFIVLEGSRIVAEASEGRGGNIRITVDNLIQLPDSLISASAGPAGIDGTVVISTPEVDLSGGLVVLEGAVVDIAGLRERCAVRRDIGASSFTGVGRGGPPPSPDGPLADAYASGFGSPGVALVPEGRGRAVSAEEHSVERAIWPAVAGLTPCHGAL
jgi:large exoprotein involved in heme utilization and adhesion